MKKLALVLGGGAAKGFAHIGVLKVLEKYNIKPDLIVGTSMGALVGGLYVCGKTPNDLENLAMKVNRIGKFSLINILFKDSMLNINKIKRLIVSEIGETTHEQTKIKFVSVATELNTGKEVHFSTGKIIDGVMASISIPGAFPRVKIGNNLYCDGGVVNNLPEDVAKKLMPDAVILSVDVLGDYEKQIEKLKMKTLESALNATTLMTTNVVKNKPKKADLRIVISQPTVSQMDFSNKTAHKSITKGVTAAKENIEQLLKMLGVKNETTRKTNKKSGKN